MHGNAHEPLHSMMLILSMIDHIQTLRRPTGAVAAAVHWLWPALLLLLALPAVRLAAQPGRIDTNQFINHFPLPDTAAPLRPIYGFNPDEFSIGATFCIWPNDTGRVGALWSIARDLGISIMETRQYADSWVGYHRYYDQLIDGAIGRDSRGRWHERLIAAGQEYRTAGYAREVILYPFDSAQSYYWPCFFRRRSGGATELNRTELDHAHSPASEQVYGLYNALPGRIVAERMVFGFDTSQDIRRYPLYPTDTTCEIAGEPFWVNNDLDFGAIYGHVPPRWLYFVLSGHLFDTEHGGREADAGLAEPLLILELWNEIPKGTTYRDSSGRVQTAAIDTAFLYRRLPVRKSELMPGADGDYNSYRQPVVMVDMITNSAAADSTADDMRLGMGGAWNSGNSRHRFELKVRWTGREKVALRSIAIRDTAAQLLFGSDAASINFQKMILDTADRLMYGPHFRTAPDSTRRDVLIRYYTGDEPDPVRYAGFNWLDSTLYRRYGGGDTMTRGVRAWHGRAGFNYHNSMLSSDNEITCEEYVGGLFDNPAIPPYFGLPRHLLMKPALREHNGGRFGSIAQNRIPELILDTNSLARSRDSVEEIYTKYVQRLTFGANVPGVLTLPGVVDWPFTYHLGTTIAGNAAWASRRTGRRMIFWPGVFSSFTLQWRHDTTTGAMILDTLLAGLPEASEIRALVNIGLCYGAQGIHYPWIGATRFYFGGDPVDTTGGVRRWNFGTDWGPHGPLMGDTVDYPRTIVVQHLDSARRNYHYDIPNIYTGWKTNRDELRWLDKEWLPKIGAELVKLRWRDGYSIHFTVPQPFLSIWRQTTHRPLPAGEIVTKVEAFDIYGKRDADSMTYVELGLFDTKQDTLNPHNPINDRNYLFVVNRRTFERSRDLNEKMANRRLTKRMQLIDSLAETRLVRLHLKLKHPDSSTMMVRVRERAPDQTPFPHAPGIPRRGLDTTLSADSAVTVMLGPGRAALLEITWLSPGNTIPETTPPRNRPRRRIYRGS
jgi:hypothetical protein